MWYDSETPEGRRAQGNEYRREATHHTLRWCLWIIVVMLLLAVGFGVGNWLYRWAATPGQVFSPENVRKQWDFAYQYRESLNAVAQQICGAERMLAKATSEVEATQRRSQQMAYEQNYAKIAAEYNARMRNAFQAGLVAPSDVPKQAPDLLTIKLQVCPS